MHVKNGPIFAQCTLRVFRPKINVGLLSRFSCAKCIEEAKTDCYWCTEEAVCKPYRGTCINVSKYFYKRTHKRHLLLLECLQQGIYLKKKTRVCVIIGKRVCCDLDQ